MGAYDLVTTVSHYLIIIFGIGLCLFLVFACLCELPHTYKGKSILAVLAFVFGAVWVFSIFSYGIIKVGVVKTVYSASEYDVEQMAVDYNARTIEDDREHKPYLVHYEGYGTEEWVYYVGKPDPQAQYLIQEG